MKHLTDLRNKRIGKLTVLEYCRDYINGKGNLCPSWKCLCDCQLSLPENERKYSYYKTNTLTRNKVVSCGCMKKEIASKIGKKYNTYDLSGECGIGYLENGVEFIFDKEDYNLIKDKWWTEDKDGYIVCKTNKSVHKIGMIRLQRLVMNCDNNNKVDHINHNLKDNRKSNLRIVSTSENGMNRTVNINNTSGVTGVHFNKGMNEWVARIQVNGVRIQLGSFPNFEEAVKARKDAEEKYFGEYSYDNSMRYTNERTEAV